MARNFDGSTDDAKNNNGISGINVSTLTTAFWIWVDTMTGDDMSLATGTATDGSYGAIFYVIAPATSGWRISYRHNFSGGLGRWTLASDAVVSTGQWEHLVVTYDSSLTTNDPSFYVNGLLNTTSFQENATPSGTAQAGIDSISLAEFLSSGSNMDGKLAEVAVWSRILSASEIAQIGNGFSPLFVPNGLEFYAPLIGKNSPEIELMGGANLTLSGTSAFAHPRIIYPSFAQIRRFGAAGAPPETAIKDLIQPGIVAFPR